MALGSVLALGALAVLAIGGAALLLRRSITAPAPLPGTDAWFAERGIIPLITDANRKQWESGTPSKNLTGGKFGDVVGYFVPDAAGPKTIPRLGEPAPGADDGTRYQIDRLPEMPPNTDPQPPPTPVYMTPDGLISSLGTPHRLFRGER